MAKAAKRREVPAIKINQWLETWEKVDFSPAGRRRKPLPHFFLLSLPAQELRSLSGIFRRKTTEIKPRSSDLGIQRQHDPERSEEISRYVQYGYPWSTLSNAKRKTQEYLDFRKPGWLPTAIVVNIIQKGEARNGDTIDDIDVISVSESADHVKVQLPYDNWTPKWSPKSVPPIEIIDGQHRLWAFDENFSAKTFEVPVVAFVGLDISWQAYLFWTINIKPKRINSSLAFDLYPLLRTEDWLENIDGHAVYRETRSQELVEALWAHPESPWYDRINMLGERGSPWVSQAAWIRSLMATFVRPWQGRGDSLGGLFGSRLDVDGEVLGWSRAQQAAFLIYAWKGLRNAIRTTKSPWAESLRKEKDKQNDLFQKNVDFAFYNPHSLLLTDQGVRGFLHVLNDLCFTMAARLKLSSWMTDMEKAATDANAVDIALKSLHNEPVAKFLEEISKSLSTFDWRTSASSNLTEVQRRNKLVFRGSSGYKELRTQILEHIRTQKSQAGSAAEKLFEARR